MTPAPLKQAKTQADESQTGNAILGLLAVLGMAAVLYLGWQVGQELAAAFDQVTTTLEQVGRR